MLKALRRWRHLGQADRIARQRLLNWITFRGDDDRFIAMALDKINSVRIEGQEMSIELPGETIKVGVNTPESVIEANRVLSAMTVPFRFAPPEEQPEQPSAEEEAT